MLAVQSFMMSLFGFAMRFIILCLSMTSMILNYGIITNPNRGMEIDGFIFCIILSILAGVILGYAFQPLF